MRYPPEELRQPSAQILRFSAVIVLIVSLYRRLFAFNPSLFDFSRCPQLDSQAKAFVLLPLSPNLFCCCTYLILSVKR